MSLVVPIVGLAVQMRSWVGQVPAAVPWRLQFFSNNVVPDENTVYGDLTPVTITVLFVPGTVLEIVLDETLWTISNANPSVALYPNQLITFTQGQVDSPGTIYGYMIVDNNNVLVCAELLDPTPFQPVTAGSGINITPRLTSQPTA